MVKLAEMKAEVGARLGVTWAQAMAMITHATMLRGQMMAFGFEGNFIDFAKACFQKTLYI